MYIVQIDGVDPQSLQGFLGGRSNVFRGPYGARRGAPKFSRQEYLISLACAFEPTEQVRR
jgi:hypothetical protein